LADLQVEAGQAVARSLGAAARFVATDVTDEGAVARAVDVAVEQFGSLDVVVTSAGIIGAVGPLSTLDLDEYEYTLAVNLRGTFLAMKHAARVMVPERAGSIVSITSPAAVAGGLGPHAYSAAKAGVIGLTQSAAAELWPLGIRVNAVLPGAVVSAMTADLTVGDATDLAAAAEALARRSPLARPARPEDVAGAVAYLASDDSAYVTGTVLRVDGGLTTAPGPARLSQPEHAGSPMIREAGGRGARTGASPVATP
jgi:NAD(P)-dependent dehydrogenase (short-subunit alcohol dehydrogenase family)